MNLRPLIKFMVNSKQWIKAVKCVSFFFFFILIYMLLFAVIMFDVESHLFIEFTL